MSRIRKSKDERRRDIVEAARYLYEKQGLTKTSVQNIADEAGVSRTLFYHYFNDKTELTSAVLDAYIAEYLIALKEWNKNRRIGDIEAGLESIIHCYRTSVSGSHPFLKALSTKENAVLYLEFLNRVASETAAYICYTTVCDYSKFHDMKIDHVYDTFYLLIFGIIGYLRHNPDASDEIIADLIAQTLHMERGKNTVSDAISSEAEAKS